MNLLYVEDDEQLAQTMKDKLTNRFSVNLAYSYNQAVDLINEKSFDIIMIDYFLPDGTGSDLCEEIRLIDPQALIMFISGNTDTSSVVETFYRGADEYIRKPFEFIELEARLDALVKRRHETLHHQQLVAGPIILSLETKSLQYQDRKLILNRKEFLLMEYFMLHKGMVVSRLALFEHVWDQQYYSSNTIDVHVLRLRKKIKKLTGKEFIKTAYGFGYQLLIT